MSILNLHAGYFAISSPLRRLDRLFNGYGYSRVVQLNRRSLGCAGASAPNASCSATGKS